MDACSIHSRVPPTFAEDADARVAIVIEPYVDLGPFSVIFGLYPNFIRSFQISERVGRSLALDTFRNLQLMLNIGNPFGYAIYTHLDWHSHRWLRKPFAVGDSFESGCSFFQVRSRLEDQRHATGGVPCVHGGLFREHRHSITFILQERGRVMTCRLWDGV